MKFSSTLLIVLSAALATFEGVAAAPQGSQQGNYLLGVSWLNLHTVVMFTDTVLSNAVFIMAILSATFLDLARPIMIGRITPRMITTTDIAIQTLRQVPLVRVF